MNNLYNRKKAQSKEGLMDGLFKRRLGEKAGTIADAGITGTDVSSGELKDPFAEEKSNTVMGIDLSSIDISKHKPNKKDLVFGMIWMIIGVVIVISYNNNFYKKLSYLPTFEKNIEILNDNRDKLLDVKEGLKTLSLKPDELDVKDKILSDNIPFQTPKLSFEQSNRIYKLAKNVGLGIESFTKEIKEMDESEIVKLEEYLFNKNLESFYKKIWFNTYSITTSSTEDGLMRFKDVLEERAEFIVDSFSFVQKDGIITYSVVIKAFYFIDEMGLEEDL